MRILLCKNEKLSNDTYENYKKVFRLKHNKENMD